MSKDGRRGGMWLAAIMIVAGIAATLRPWWYPAADPVTLAERAYEQGDWQRAVDARIIPPPQPADADTDPTEGARLWHQ